MSMALFRTGGASLPKLYIILYHPSALDNLRALACLRLGPTSRTPGEAGPPTWISVDPSEAASHNLPSLMPIRGWRAMAICRKE
jgi:hypothetical protein